MSSEDKSFTFKEFGSDVILVAIAAALIYICNNGISIYDSCHPDAIPKPGESASFNIRALHAGVGMSAGIITSVVFNTLGKHIQNPETATYVISAMIAIAFLITGILIVRASTDKNRAFIGDAMIGVAAGFAISQTVTYVINYKKFSSDVSNKINIVLIALLMAFFSALCLNVYYSAPTDQSVAARCGSVSLVLPWILAVVGSMTAVGTVVSFWYNPFESKELEKHATPGIEMVSFHSK